MTAAHAFEHVMPKDFAFSFREVNLALRAFISRDICATSSWDISLKHSFLAKKTKGQTLRLSLRSLIRLEMFPLGYVLGYDYDARRTSSASGSVYRFITAACSITYGI